ncbi:MAG: NifU family protein [Alphaproteobacteria bacterium]|nr:NifU family protein [Alphaproteobacteria bacterium]
MFIQTEATPNPATMKFLPGQPVLSSGTREFLDSATAFRISPLAGAIFGVEGVRSVFFGTDFVTVSKSDNWEWSHLKPAILGVFMEHFTSGAPVIRDSEMLEEIRDEQFDAADQKIVEMIKELLDTRVRPAVANDGGDIVFHSYRKGIVFLHMRGACSGCPSSTVTLKNGIENLLRHFIPEVTEVCSI